MIKNTESTAMKFHNWLLFFHSVQIRLYFGQRQVIEIHRSQMIHSTIIYYHLLVCLNPFEDF